MKRREEKTKENPSEDFSTKGREDWCLNSSFMWRELELAGTRVSRDRGHREPTYGHRHPFHILSTQKKNVIWRWLERGAYGQPSIGARLGVLYSLSSSKTAAEAGLRRDKNNIFS